MKDLWKSNREFTAMIAMPSIALTLAFFPEFFVVMTALLMAYEIAAVVLWPAPVEDPAVVEVDKILAPWILTLKSYFKRTVLTRFLGSIPMIAVMPFAYHYNVRLLHANPLKFYGIAVVVSSSDVIQYYIGKNFGKVQAVSISPKKTLEGYIGGGLLCVFQCYIMLNPTDADTFGHIFLKGLYLIVFGVIGDLFNAFWKRIMGVKDSSSILGSHGGIHDRFGSVVFALALTECFGLDFDFSKERIIAVLVTYVFGALVLVINKLLDTRSNNGANSASNASSSAASSGKGEQSGSGGNLSLSGSGGINPVKINFSQQQ